MLRFFRDLERLAYSMLIRRSGVNERIERFSSLTEAIEQRQDLYSLDSPLQLSAKEQFETYEALNGPLYETHSARALSVILLRLDELVSGGGAIYDHDVITVEHVLPQQPKPDSRWVAWLPSPQVRLHWVHRLGNLALLTRKKNSAANNYDFDRKKSAYFAKGGVSPFALTTQVLGHAEWTATELESRQTQLMELLEQEWRLEDRESPQATMAKKLALQSAGGQPVEFELLSVKLNLKAEARVLDDAFVVLQGSKAKAAWTGVEHGYKALRQALVDEGALIPDGAGAFVFARNIPFNSPSAASAVIFGRPDNGRTSWMLKGTELTYADWLGSALDERIVSSTTVVSSEALGPVE